ncbi:putative NAD dependent epimerase/dehydratase family protein [Janibacter sp. HTCC2649]|uniref:TIGR01777 family oxidoreductase n=1 Tax=Janibacter sp. HTCC2649 TaxID=313589 RepID=UPI000066EC7D|nr:TIGR01777 family oxidoreductase [Janibacter sp. HTCC2649]EAP98762.1 putative NAD dependent epimerase/dehydratase family protein [Janibacter sp. HTCC2649]
MTQRIAVAGSSGLIGAALCHSLRERGDDVVRLVRRAPEHESEIQWDPSTRQLDPAVLDGVDAVVNVAGASLGAHRWSPAFKTELINSRVDGTTALATAIAQTGRPIHLVNGSAVGYYGDRGDEVLTEESSAGSGFLVDLVHAWEGATEPAEAAGAPVACLRTGIVLAPDGDAIKMLLRLAKLGLGGPLGNGRQFWSWITLADHVRAIEHVLDQRLEGPVNLTGPEPARQRDIVAEMGRQLHRPTLLPAPTFALRAVVGEMAGDIVASQRAVPKRLQDTGFTHGQATLPDAIRWLLTAPA